MSHDSLVFPKIIIKKKKKPYAYITGQNSSENIMMK